MRGAILLPIEGPRPRGPLLRRLVGEGDARGVVAGLWWRPLGIATAAALVLYFGVAVVFHVRAHDTRRIAMPLAIAVRAVISLALRTL